MSLYKISLTTCSLYKHTPTFAGNSYNKNKNKKIREITQVQNTANCAHKYTYFSLE